MVLRVYRPIAMPDVAAADRYPLQLDETLAILDGRHLHIDELEKLGTHQLCCFHTLSISRKPAELAQRVALCARNRLHNTLWVDIVNFCLTRLGGPGSSLAPSSPQPG